MRTGRLKVKNSTATKMGVKKEHPRLGGGRAECEIMAAYLGTKNVMKNGGRKGEGEIDSGGENNSEGS